MIKMPAIQFDAIEFKGGLDQVTPTLSLKPGVCKSSSNFECSVYGGNTRVAGYERFDGQAAPSAATHTIVYIATILSAPAVGNTLTGATSGATGVIAAIAGGYVVITKQSLSFTVGEMAAVGATNIGVVTSPAGTITTQLSAVYLAAAADIYREDIGKPPGSGGVTGVFLFNDIVYAFRDNTGGTATDLYKSSAAGWVNVPYFYEVSFTAGTNMPAEGTTLTQGGVTATIKRVCTESAFNTSTGAWSAGTAAGRFIITAPAGGNFAAGAATANGGVTTVTLAAVQTAITFSPGGRFETIKENFSGGLSTFRVYGCDGVNRAWEFDGTILVPISTGNGAADIPKHIWSHKNYLVLAIQTSVFLSAPGWPFCYTATNGAVEFAIGDTVAGMISLPGSQTSAALFIFGRGRKLILYGTSSSDFNLVSYNDGYGAIDYSVQNMSSTLAMDDRGVQMVQASLNYGNFDQSTLTHNIQPFIEARGSALTASVLCRSKSQYRAFFSDGYGLYVTIVNGKWLGSMPVYFPTVVNCTYEGKYANGDDASFFGGADGYVHQFEKGTSFDGANIYAYMTTNYASSGNTRLLKSYRRAAIEVQGNGYASVNFGYYLGYGSDEISQPTASQYETNFSAPQWDRFYWDSFYWDGKTLLPSECSMEGTAENVALAFYSDSNYYKPFTLNTAILHYLPRRAMR